MICKQLMLHVVAQRISLTPDTSVPLILPLLSLSYSVRESTLAFFINLSGNCNFVAHCIFECECISE